MTYEPADSAVDQHPGPIAPDEAGLQSRHVVSRAERTLTLLMLGRLKRRGGDTLCRIRNVSSGGLRVDTGSPLEKGESVEVEARSGVCVEGRVAWTNRLTAGIAFVERIDQSLLLAAPKGASGKSVTVRSPRFAASARARLDLDGRVTNVRLVNISLGGCRIECETRLPREIAGYLSTARLPKLACAGRWSNGNEAGLIFPTRLDFLTFANWLEQPDFRFSTKPLTNWDPQREVRAGSATMLFSRPRNS